MTGSKLSFGVGVEEDCSRKYLPIIVGYLSGWTSMWRVEDCISTVTGKSHHLQRNKEFLLHKMGLRK